jgi:drug/metabolite transporter (DMT)-like permease
MFPMIIRIAQAVFVFFGAVLLVAALQVTFTPSHPHAAFQHISAFLVAIFYTFFGFLCFVVAYRIGKWRKKTLKKKNVPPTYLH